MSHSTGSGSDKKTYSTQCLDGKTITVDGSSIGPTSKYKDYKQLVCQACGVKRCTDTTLFKGYSKKDDHGRVIFGNLNRLALKSYGSEDKEISYKCPSGENVQTLKDCLVTLCEECRSSNCEVYAGSTKVSSGIRSTLRPRP